MKWTEWRQRDGSDEVGPDREVASALKSMDPASKDPNYWMRFSAGVMWRAKAELRRRRLVADLTVGDVLSAWARAIVPTAILAAAVAALILMRTASLAPPVRTTVEDLLVAGLEDETIPATLSTDDGTISMVAFSGESF